MVDNEEFVVIGPKNRPFARYFGLDVDHPRPYLGVSLIPYLQKLRDDAIDQLINAYLVQDDPMADASATTNAKVSCKKRMSTFANANIPNAIEVEAPAFTNADGKAIPAAMMKVATSNRRGAALEIKLDEANLEWLYEAIWHQWMVVESPKNRRIIN